MFGTFIQRIAICGLAVLHLAGCTTLQTVQIPDEGDRYLSHPVSVGNDVEVVMKDGTRHNFEVTRVTEEGLGGSPGFLPYADMASLQRRVRNDAPGQWIGVILAIALVVFLVSESDAACINCVPPE